MIPGSLRNLGFALTLLLAATAAAAQAPPIQPPTFQVNVGLVNVFVTVTDPAGAPVAGLDENNFVLLEDGRPQKIAVFERQTDLPLHIVLAIDTSGSVRTDLPLEKAAALRFVRSLLRPTDQLDLMEFSDGVRNVVPFTNNANSIERGLRNLRRGSATALYRAVELAAERLEAFQGRKVLLLISDGGNTITGTTYPEALDAAVRAEAVVYSIIDVPIRASAGRDLAGEHAMITLSEQTGGEYYYTDQASLDQIFERVSESLRTQYLLAYYPSAQRETPGFRTISVKLQGLPRAADYTIRNRAGYYPASSSSSGQAIPGGRNGPWGSSP